MTRDSAAREPAPGLHRDAVGLVPVLFLSIAAQGSQAEGRRR